MKPELHVTLWPTFTHFPKFAFDSRLSGIRLNSAMMNHPELDRELRVLKDMKPTVPCYFDVKGRQLRVAEVLDNPSYLDIRLNHPVSGITLPVVVLLKAGGDAGLVTSISEDGYRLTFGANPQFSVRTGESVCIKDKGLVVGLPLFTHAEVEKIARVKASGLINKWYLSYVEEEEDIEAFRGLIGDEDEVLLKIESQRGLDFVKRYSPYLFPRTRLVAACGDLYVEMDKPHQTLGAIESIVQADPTAIAGSRMMLSTMRSPTTYLQNLIKMTADKDPSLAGILPLLGKACEPAVPDLADFAQLAWLSDIGFNAALLCDEICLSGPHLENAVCAFSEWSRDYCG